jgi:acyl carrier protein
MLRPDLDRDQIAALVRDEIRQLLEERGEPADTVSEGDNLAADLGFSSLDLAQLVAELEQRLGEDPFTELVPITSVRNVRDLVDAYMMLTGTETRPGPADDGSLERVRQRAGARSAWRRA